MFKMRNCYVLILVALGLWSIWNGGTVPPLMTDHHPRDVMNDFCNSESSIQVFNLRQLDINLSQYIWQNAIDLLPQAWKTTFIAGVANGTMNPNFYGDYNLQDAIYCRKVAQLWTQLANNASVHADIKSYANGSISGFQECSISLFDRWNVKDDRENGYGVNVREPVTDYVTFISDTMLASPPNMLIATYACLQLWHNLTGELWAIVKNSTTNPYRVWVEENHGSGSSARRQAAQMDEWDQIYNWYNRSEALTLFRIAVLNEINFFDHGGNSSEYVTINVKRPLKLDNM